MQEIKQRWLAELIAAAWQISREAPGIGRFASLDGNKATMVV
jgi:hypothetical protein